jgi:hypothetical protein
MFVGLGRGRVQTTYSLMIHSIDFHVRYSEYSDTPFQVPAPVSSLVHFIFRYIHNIYIYVDIFVCLYIYQSVLIVKLVFCSYTFAKSHHIIITVIVLLLLLLLLLLLKSTQ